MARIDRQSVAIDDPTAFITAERERGISVLVEGDLITAGLIQGNPQAVDQLFADETVTNPSTAGDVVWPLADGQGTIRDLAVYNSGSDTTTVENHRVYNGFGKLESQTNSAVDCLFGYTGRPYDRAR